MAWRIAYIEQNSIQPLPLRVSYVNSLVQRHSNITQYSPFSTELGPKSTENVEQRDSAMRLTDTGRAFSLSGMHQ